MSSILPLFQQYQHQFTNHIRNPHGHPRPENVPVRRMRVYNEIVFNNIESTLAACFPVAKKVLGKRAWMKLTRGFFGTHRCQSPLFRQIPEEFLRYLETAENLLPFLQSLAHYEWVELAVSIAEAENDWNSINREGDLLEGRPVLAAAMALLTYDYPVQRISPRFKPHVPLDQPVCLMVFRDAEDNVRFIELNTVTARLLDLLRAGNLTGRQALERIAEGMQHPDVQAVFGFGKSVLAELRQQGAILGVATNRSD